MALGDESDGSRVSLAPRINDDISDSLGSIAQCLQQAEQVGRYWEYFGIKLCSRAVGGGGMSTWPRAVSKGGLETCSEEGGGMVAGS